MIPWSPTRLTSEAELEIVVSLRTSIFLLEKSATINRQPAKFWSPQSNTAMEPSDINASVRRYGVDHLDAPHSESLTAAAGELEFALTVSCAQQAVIATTKMSQVHLNVVGIVIPSPPSSGAHLGPNHAQPGTSFCLRFPR